MNFSESLNFLALEITVFYDLQKLRITKDSVLYELLVILHMVPATCNYGFQVDYFQKGVPWIDFEHNE